MTAYRPNPGPQEKAFACQADIMLFGGGAGSSKSNYLVVQPLAHIANPKFNGIVFRRTYPQIFQPGGLWDETQAWYPSLGGRPTLQPTRWTFPAGSKIELASIQHEKDVKNYQGGQFAFIGFDELTHFSKKMFFYLVSRNRSMSGIKPYIRATCNPEAGSWVADLIAWWIDQETGYPIPERSGVIRWFYHIDDVLYWYDSRAEAEASHPELAKIARPKSFTFIPAKITDNPQLMAKDPDYMANLLSLPKIERYRLLDGNWKIAEASIIEAGWIRRFGFDPEKGKVFFSVGDRTYDGSKFQRFAIIDTAGTSEQKAKEKRGKSPSYTCCGIFDYHEPLDMLLWRDVWRSRVSWNELVSQLPAFLDRWEVRDLRIENAHHGQALFDEMREKYSCRYVGPVIEGMATGTARGAKLERAVASGILQRFEFGTILLPPTEDCWPSECTSQLISWTGLDDEIADLVDVGSYASHVVKTRKRRMRVA